MFLKAKSIYRAYTRITYTHYNQRLIDGSLSWHVFLFSFEGGIRNLQTQTSVLEENMLLKTQVKKRRPPPTHQ